MIRIIVACLLAVFAAQVQAQDHGLAGRVGMLGLGVEYSYAVNERLALRAGLNGSGFGFDAEEAGIEYEFDFEWESLSAAIDLHPMRGSFRLSAGVLSNDNRLEAVSRPTADVTIGGDVYTPAEVGTLTAGVGFDDVAPFLGLGWDWSRSGGRFGVALDLGVVKQGEPEVVLTATGALSDPALSQDVEAERLELQSALEDFDLLPFATLGFVFRF